ncbi:MAG TPA: CusA/CzcA family heavy metal efflux RND transporter [Phycisphaerales bacterium]|nr:CusA/CzcA family heavy metal efflux RND transporter [Phycisphaerales bacterium]
MLAKLIAFSLRQSSLVVVFAGLLLVFAGVTIRNMPVDVFPELNAPTVVVMTEAGGFAADEVELNVTFPIETAVNGLPGARRVRSASATSLSIVWVEFDWGTDIYRARQLVSERLSAVRESLPPGSHAEITPVTSITGEIMLIALSSPDGSASPLELRTFAEFDLRNKLLAVPGVAQVVAIGGELPQYQINVRQDQLALYGLTISDVVEAARGAHSTASAGYIPSWENQELPIRQTARVTSAEDIKSTLVRYHKGAAVTIGQLADVRLGASPKRGTAADRALPGVVLSVQKSPGTNTLNLTAQIDGVLDQVEKSMPTGMVLNRDPFRASRFIERSINGVVRVLIEASVIVAVILMLFLLNARATIVTLTALPLSLAVAVLLLWAWGLSINVMTLGGLAVAIGELVDDAIIDVENVLRRLRENAGLPDADRKGFVEVIYNASNEIRSSVVFATVIICMVFVPLLFLQGLEGRFFQPLGIAYIVSIMASLVVALTVTPALCKWLFARPFGRASEAGSAGHGHREHDGWLVRWLKHRYEPALRASVRSRGVVLTGAGLLTAGSLVLMSTFGTSFLPAFKEGTFTVFLLAPPGTSLVESNRLATGVEAQMAQIEGVSSVTRRTGRAERDEHAEPVSSSEIEVTMRAGADQDRVRTAIDRVIANIPGITTMVGQPIEHRLSHVLSGTPAAIAINVYGDDLDVLRSLAKEIEAAIKPIPGTRDVAANREIMITSLSIRYRAQDLAGVGLSPGAAAEQVRQALYGETVAEVNQGVRRYEMVVRLAESERERLDQIMDLQLRGAGGAIVRLREVADIGPERTSNLIARESAQRKAVVTTNVADGYNLGQLVAQVKARVDPIVQGAGYTVHYGGQFEAQQSASRTILIMGAGVGICMFLLLQLSTGRARVALLVMLNLPLALIGGIAAIYLTESPSVLGNSLALLGLASSRYVAPVISIASMVGFITLFGIAVRNGILLVNHYDHLQEHEGKSICESIIQGSQERLVPILMTALAAMLGLVPLALAKGKPGSELLAPLAIVVLGGLISSTILNLFVVPAGYALVFRVEVPPGNQPRSRARVRSAWSGRAATKPHSPPSIGEAS